MRVKRLEKIEDIMAERTPPTWAVTDSIGHAIEYPAQLKQDRFVAGVCAHIHAGSFVDIGAGEPKKISNTYALEKSFGWSGLLCDIEHFSALERDRSPKNIVLRDALAPTSADWSFHFASIATKDRWIDFLSLDLEPPDLAISVLLALPLNTFRFRVCCIEHDAYREERGKIRRDLIRCYMAWLGYNQVSCAGLASHGEIEDWFVHPNAGIDAAPTLRALQFTQ